MDSSTLLPLIGIPVVVIGFALRFNPLLVVVVAGLATGLLVGMDFGMLLETFGEKFVNSRSLATFILILPVIGLMSLGGHAQTVRPLLAPMAEGAALNEYGELPQTIRDKIKAHAAACDNIAVFFGEDIFIAFGAVLLIDAFLKENGIEGIEPLHIGLWAIPTAIAALVIHMTRLLRLDASIRRDVMAWRAEQGTQEIAP
ncbi:DUF969 domain-containing protein [Enterobacter hormaechei]|uniref:DUF969 domain-containing protein n=1 Tax=Enterobacter hormaechei TaxID=158836 RepID=UPI003CED51FF